MTLKYLTILSTLVITASYSTETTSSEEPQLLFLGDSVGDLYTPSEPRSLERSSEEASKSGSLEYSFLKQFTSTSSSDVSPQENPSVFDSLLNIETNLEEQKKEHHESLVKLEQQLNFLHAQQQDCQTQLSESQLRVTAQLTHIEHQNESIFSLEQRVNEAIEMNQRREKESEMGEKISAQLLFSHLPSLEEIKEFKTLLQELMTLLQENKKKQPKTPFSFIKAPHLLLGVVTFGFSIGIGSGFTTFFLSQWFKD